MIIDKEKLTSLLIERTGLERAQVKNQLSQLIGCIQDAAENGKSFEIEGFGTFTLEDEQLQFHPADVLETEINHKYAGMKPIELIGAFKETDAGDKEINADEVPPLVEKNEINEEKIEAEVDLETGERSWVFDETSASEQDRIEKAILGRNFDKPGEDEPVKDKVVETPGAISIAEESPEAREKDAEAVSETENDAIGKVLTVAVVVLVIGVLGWVIYDMGLADSYTMNDQSSLQNKLVQQPEPSPQDINQGQNESEQAEADETPEPDQLSGVTGARDEVSLQPEEKNSYGLHGEVNNSVNAGYTIVVHSLKSLEKANAIKKLLRSAGFRVMVMEARINSTNYYRVGLGQFQSIEASQQAVNQLPEEFQNNNFIKRF